MRAYQFPLSCLFSAVVVTVVSVGVAMVAAQMAVVQVQDHVSGSDSGSPQSQAQTAHTQTSEFDPVPVPEPQTKFSILPGVSVNFGVEEEHQEVHHGSGGRKDVCECNCERRKLVPLYRYRNEDTGTHLLTISKKDAAISSGGFNVSQGITAFVFKSAVPGTQPVQRFFNPETSDYFYTTNLADLSLPSLSGYVFVQVEFYIDVLPRCTGEVPLYRYVNAEGVGGAIHCFTANFQELGAGSQGFVYESIPGFVFPPPSWRP